jgi:hypothetical protein
MATSWRRRPGGGQENALTREADWRLAFSRPVAILHTSDAVPACQFEEFHDPASAAVACAGAA